MGLEFLQHLDFGAVGGFVSGALVAIGVAWRFVIGGIKAVKESEKNADKAALSAKRVSGAVNTLDTLQNDVEVLRTLIDELQQERASLLATVAQIEAKAKLEKEELEIKIAVLAAQSKFDKSEISALQARVTQLEHDLIKKEGQLTEAKQTNLDLTEEITSLKTGKPKVRKPRTEA